MREGERDRTLDNEISRQWKAGDRIQRENETERHQVDLQWPNLRVLTSKQDKAPSHRWDYMQMGLPHLRVLTTLPCVCVLSDILMWKKRIKGLSSCAVARGKQNVNGLCVFLHLCIFFWRLLIALGVCVPLYMATKCLFACVYWETGSEAGCWQSVCVLPFQCDCLSPQPSRWLSLPFLYAYDGHPVIVGRDSKHVAVYNHHSHRAGQCLLHLVISTTDPAHQYKHRCQAAWGIWQDLSASSLRLICCYVPSDLQKLSVLKDTFESVLYSLRH